MEKITKKIGVFILNYNGVDWLQKNLKNIIEYSQNTPITIIDNNSTDHSINYIKSNFPTINIEINPKNYGFSKGYNTILLNEFKFQYFVLINNDVEVTKNWLEPMFELINSEEEIGIVQPKILNLTDKKQFDYAGAAGGGIDVLGIPFCRGRIVENIEKDFGQYDDNMQIFWASGCCFMIESVLFKKLNGFDEDLFMHQEEIDLCWRAQSKNKKSYYCHESTIYHYGGGTLESTSPIKHYYNHRNSLLLLLKNVPFHLLVMIFPIRLVINYLVIIYYFITGFLYCVYTAPLYLDKVLENPEHKKGIEKIKISYFILIAHISFLFLFPKFLKKRSPINAKHIYPRSIIFEYYIRGKKKFSELKQF